jgi:hypothetical protein
MLKAVCCLLVAVALFGPLAVWLNAAIEVDPQRHEKIAQLFVERDQCLPEPGERLAFLTGLVFLPAAIFGLSYACHRWGAQPGLQLSPAVRRVVEVVVGVLLFVVYWIALRREWYFHVRPNIYFDNPLASLPLLVASLAALAWCRNEVRWVRIVLHLLVAFAVGVMVLGCLFDEKAIYAHHAHFSAVFTPVVQVHHGKDLLIDCTNQYGLYPHFLEPIFAWVGLSVWKFTIVMGLLLAVSYAVLWLFLSQALRYSLTAFIGFLALVSNTWFYFVRASSGDFNLYIDPYFQYFPIRMLFPASLVFLAWLYFQHGGRWLYWGTMVFLAAGVLWNIDAGLPTFAAWLCGLSFAEFFANDWRTRIGKIVGHACAGAVAVAGVFGVYSAVMYARHGSLPHYGQLVHYQKLFYLSGFYMLPMRFPRPWVLVILVYLAGLTCAAFALLAKRDTVRAKMYFLLSVLGAGLFAYYQGRSHPFVLVLVWWPCFLLLALFLDELIAYLREGNHRPLPWLAAGLLAWILSGSAWGMVTHLQLLRPRIAKDIQTALSDGPAQLEGDTAALKRIIPTGEEVVVVSLRDSLFHVATGIPSGSHCAFMQLVLMEDFWKVRRKLEQRPEIKVFVDAGVFEYKPLVNGTRLLRELLQERYRVMMETPTGQVWQRISVPPAPGGGAWADSPRPSLFNKTPVSSGSARSPGPS